MEEEVTKEIHIAVVIAAPEQHLKNTPDLPSFGWPL
jgi:hypothetical protein